MIIEPIYLELAARIRKRREKICMTQADLAAKLNLHRVTVTNVEAGRQRIMIHQLPTIAGALGTTVSKLMKGLFWS